MNEKTRKEIEKAIDAISPKDMKQIRDRMIPHMISMLIKDVVRLKRDVNVLFIVYILTTVLLVIGQLIK